MKREKDTRARRRKLRTGFIRADRTERRLRRQLAVMQREKERLLEELQGLCLHGRVLEFSGELVDNLGDVLTNRPMRVCADCNLIDHEPYGILAAEPFVKASYGRLGEYRVLGVPLG